MVEKISDQEDRTQWQMRMRQTKLSLCDDELLGGYFMKRVSSSYREINFKVKTHKGFEIIERVRI